jgi:molecular chaperone GrpE
MSTDTHQAKAYSETSAQQEHAEHSKAVVQPGENEVPQAENSEDSAIQQIQADLERFRDLALRSQADFENYRKRANREKDEAVRYANFSLVEKLVPVLDSFELGLTAARGNDGAAPIVSGMEMVKRQLEEVLHQAGVEPVDATGLPFDPNLHEAVAQEPSNEVAEGAVVRQLRRGYRIKDRLVRAALVIVSGGPAA